MKSKMFLCLLLIVTMLAFVGCADNKDNGTLTDDARDLVNDAGNSIDRMTDDMLDGNAARDVDDDYRSDPLTDGVDSINNTSKASVGSAY